MNWGNFWSAFGIICASIAIMATLITCGNAWFEVKSRVFARHPNPKTYWRVVLFFRWVPLTLVALFVLIGIPVIAGFSVPS